MKKFSLFCLLFAGLLTGCNQSSGFEFEDPDAVQNSQTVSQNREPNESNEPGKQPGMIDTSASEAPASTEPIPPSSDPVVQLPDDSEQNTESPSQPGGEDPVQAEPVKNDSDSAGDAVPAHSAGHVFDPGAIVPTEETCSDMVDNNGDTLVDCDDPLCKKFQGSLCSSHAGCCRDGAVAIEVEGLPNLFQVSDDLYRSGQPVKNGLTSARELGIQTVLSLQIIQLDLAFESSENTGLNLVHVAMTPSDISYDQIVTALKVIKDSPKPVLVHCTHGSDRTGLTVAMYRMVFLNWSREDARNELINGGFGFHESFDNIPEMIDNADVDALKKAVFED